MLQAKDASTGKQAHSSHMSKRPPRLSLLTGTPEQPHMHAEQRAVDEVTEWVSMEGGHVNPLDVPKEVMRPGWICQWKVKSVLGSEDSNVKRMLTQHYRAGWRPVPGERGAGYFFLPGEQVPPMIEIGGQILMERPVHIEAHARKLNEGAAREQLNNKLEEVGLKSPDNVRSKLIIHRTVQGEAISSVGVPD